MQEKRHDADYDPSARFAKSAIVADIKSVIKVMENFKIAKTSDRRAFCAYVLLKDRNN